MGESKRRTNLEYERAECCGAARFLGGFAIPVALLAILAACATSDVPPRLAEIQHTAWVEHAYEVRVDDWSPAWHGDCRNKARMVMATLEAEGWHVGALVGCRTDEPGHVRNGQCDLEAYRQGWISNPVHMVPVVAQGADGPWYVVDRDRVWRAGEHPLVELEGYDWRVAAAAAPDD